MPAKPDQEPRFAITAVEPLKSQSLPNAVLPHHADAEAHEVHYDDLQFQLKLIYTLTTFWFIYFDYNLYLLHSLFIFTHLLFDNTYIHTLILFTFLNFFNNKLKLVKIITFITKRNPNR